MEARPGFTRRQSWRARKGWDPFRDRNSAKWGHDGGAIGSLDERLILEDILEDEEEDDDDNAVVDDRW